MPEITYGHCQCGCGQKTNIAKLTDKRVGAVRGAPRKFIAGHRIEKDIKARFWEKVEIKSNEDCWPWIACTNRGYGVFRINGVNITSNRGSWMFTHGEIPDGLYVLHKCDNPTCCNPTHLFLGTHSDNMSDMVSKNRQNLGERHGMSKLTDKQALEIKRLKPVWKASGNGELVARLAKKYNMHPDNIYFIWRGDTWKHVQ